MEPVTFSFAADVTHKGGDSASPMNASDIAVKDWWPGPPPQNGE